MTIDTNTVVSMSEANQNFSKVARTVDQFGKAVIFKNNSPKYMVLDFTIAEKADSSSHGSSTQDKVTYVPASHEEVMAVSKQLMEKYDAAYKELAK